MAVNSGPIRSVTNVCKWLESRSWILAADPYDWTRLVNILATAALMSKLLELRNMALAVAFLLDADVMDHVLETLANAVADKAIGRLEGLVEKLGSMANFLAASDAKCTETTLTLKATSETLKGVTILLGAMAPNTTNPPPRKHVPAAPLTWALLAKASSSPSTLLDITKAPAMHDLSHEEVSKIQQCVLHDTCTVLIEFDPNDTEAPSDFMATGSSKLRNDLNKILKRLDERDMALRKGEDGETEMVAPRTHVIGLKNLSRSAYLAEFDTADSASRFRRYATTNWIFFTAIFGDGVSIVDKTYSIIARFVPCLGSFDPGNTDCLHTIELENSLKSDTITSAPWLKQPDQHSSKQSVASLKISCNDANTANALIEKHIFIGGHLVPICKDICEPIRRRDAVLTVPARTTQQPPALCSDRGCPEFARQCAELDTCFPKNRMLYFPTDKPLTWTTAPLKLTPKPPSELTRPLATLQDFMPSLPPAPPSQQKQPLHPQPPTQHTPAGSRAPSRMGNLDSFGFTSQPGGQNNKQSILLSLSST
ncbi:hypothetical protein J132_04019 [Termitomyces sp. J132]|nr:hypothetical protein J132_04019 [Termitomyces sp. J132]